MSQTISQILNTYNGFEKAFWASYSVNFTTLDFLLKKDFKYIMEPHYLHLICDGHQLDESIAKIDEDRKDMSILSKLQEYCTISPQFAEGSFHPKILLFASETELLFIVSSANATHSGILSNQDLISSFYYDDEHPENKNQVCLLYQYMQSFDGWGAEAREDLKVLEEYFAFLKEELSTDVVLTVPNQNSLLSQITAGLPKKEIQRINIFSPFFDDEYKAISEIESKFKVPVNIFSPQKEFQTARKDNFSSNVKFYQSGTEINKVFHAKFYEFNYGEESIVYWGSANCSYSGLLSADRNYEFLIKSALGKESICSLWGSLCDKKESSVKYDQKVDKDKKNKDKPDIYVEGVSATEKDFVIQLNKPLPDNACLKGIVSNGVVVDFTILSAEEKTIHASCEENGLVIFFIEKDQKRISNLIYINNPFAIQARVSGAQDRPDLDPRDIDSSKAVTLVFGYFNLKLPQQNNNRPHSTASRKGFWRLPQFKSRSRLSAIINLEEFVKQRVVKLKEKNDPEKDPEDPPSSGNDRKTVSTSPPKSLFNIITKETDKLLKNIISIVSREKISEIETYRWLQGIDLLNCYILDTLDEIQNLPKENKELIDLLLNTSKVSTWIICNLVDESRENNVRIELMKSIQEILLGLSIYSSLLDKKLSTRLHDDQNTEYRMAIKRALFLRHILNEKFPEFNFVSEHSQLTYEDILEKLPDVKLRKETLMILRLGEIRKFTGLDQVLVFANSFGSFLFIKKADTKMELETILGEKKKFTLTAPLTKKDILQDNDI